MNAKICQCKIDEEGTYKYIQIECVNKQNKEDKKIIIRGDGNCSYHPNPQSPIPNHYIYFFVNFEIII